MRCKLCQRLPSRWVNDARLERCVNLPVCVVLVVVVVRLVGLGRTTREERSKDATGLMMHY